MVRSRIDTVFIHTYVHTRLHARRSRDEAGDRHGGAGVEQLGRAAVRAARPPRRRRVRARRESRQQRSRRRRRRRREHGPPDCRRPPRAAARLRRCAAIARRRRRRGGGGGDDDDDALDATGRSFLARLARATTAQIIRLRCSARSRPRSPRGATRSHGRAAAPSGTHRSGSSRGRCVTMTCRVRIWSLHNEYVTARLRKLARRAP